MKTIVPFLLMLLTSFFVQSQNRDLPLPNANMQTLPTGSYVIAMDNALQANASGNFNLKAYGLVVHLLNNNIKIKWSIRSGKAKDGTDFTANAVKFQPTLTA